MQHYQTARWEQSDLLLYVYIQPKAAVDKVAGLFQNAIKIQITAPATDNKANEHLRRWIAKASNISLKQVTIENGAHSRYKLIRIHSLQQLPAWLCAWLPKEIK